MKTKFVLIQLLVLLSICIACTKLEFRNDITGTWKFLYASGGISGQSFDTYFTHLQIKKNYHYFIYRNDTLLASGDYDLLKSSSYPDYREPYEIEFNKSFVQDSKLKFPFDERLFALFDSDGTFILDEGCCDRFQYGFAKP